MVVLSLGQTLFLSLSLSLSLSLCMCVCVCMCMYVCMYVCTCMYVSMYVLYYIMYVCTQVLHSHHKCAHTQGDSSASENADSALVDERIRLILDTQDPKIVGDLRQHNPGRPPKNTNHFGSNANSIWQKKWRLQ